MRILPLLLCAGCWPHISGDWTDYYEQQAAPVDTDTAEPAEVAVIGYLFYISFLGNYWTNKPDDVGAAAWGLSSDPTLDPLAALLIDGMDCVPGEPDIAGPFIDSVDPMDIATSTIVGPDRNIRLVPGSGGIQATNGITEDDVSGFFRYDLAPVAVDAETYAVDRFLRMPDDYVFTPDLDRALLSRAAPEDLVFDWDITGGADWMVGSVALLDSRDGVVDAWTCIAPESEGRLKFPTDLWTGDGVTWYVSLNAVRAEESPILDQPGRVSRTLGVRAWQGMMDVR